MRIMARRRICDLRGACYHTAGDRVAHRLCELFDDPAIPCRLSAAGVAAHLGESPLGPEQTCFENVCFIPPGHQLVRDGSRWRLEPLAPPPPPDGSLFDLLAAALECFLARGDVALALSGGLDSALALAIIRRVLGRQVPVYSLTPSIPGYSERERVVRVAEELDCRPILIEVNESDFVQALPNCVRHAEVPFYNLHPVSKYLLAQRLRADGFRHVITGDGADQVFAHTPGWDYLPIVGALFAACQVEVCSPFLDEAVAARAAAAPADPDKSALRAAGRDLLPAEWLLTPKRAQLAPPMNLRPLWDADRIAQLARRLGRPLPDAPGSPSAVKCVTLALLSRAFPRLDLEESPRAAIPLAEKPLP
jgi:hypothetical protein